MNAEDDEIFTINTRAYFSDHDVIINGLLSKAENSIKIAVAWISFELFQAQLIAAVKRGVTVSLYLTELRGEEAPKNVSYLKENGVKIDVISPKSGVLMHHKFCIIDKKTVINGSFNWTHSAKKNFENITVFYDANSLAEEFDAEFNELGVYTKANYQSLKSSHACPKCGKKKLIKILVLDYHPINTIERMGDVIEYCTKCEESRAIKQGIQDTGFYSLKCEVEEKMNFGLYERKAAAHASIYTAMNIPLHAVGFVTPTDQYEEDKYTKIIWKHRLFKKRIEDEYSDYFGVYYGT